MIKVAIITVDYNNHSDTEEFKQSVEKLNTKGLDVKIIYVNNGSETPLDIDGEVLQTGDNKGFTGGYNAGIKYGMQWGAEYFLIVNNDVLFPDKNLLIKLLSHKTDVVSPKILFAPGFEYQKERYQKSDLGHVVWYAGGSFDWDNVQTIHRGIDEVDHGQFDVVEDTAFPSGCCVLVKREVYEKVGLFDEFLWTYFEDADIAKRTNAAGFKQLYDGQTYIYHKVSRSSGIGSPLTDYLTTRNQLIFGFRYAPNWTKFALMRQAGKFLITGRRMQRKAVVDFMSGKTGRPEFIKSNPNPSFQIKLSIIIINYKTVELTRKCLQSIFKFRPNFPIEVILIDNASEDTCSEMVKEFPEVKFIANKINKGFSGGNNQGIDYSRGEYVLLLNSDTEVRKDSLTKLVSTTDDFKGQAITAGRLFFPDGSDQDSVSNLPTPWHAFEEYFLNKKGSYFMYRPNTLTRVECAVMACYLIPKKVINKIGKLDEGTFMYFEDIEYSRRAKENNIPIYFLSEAEFIHHHGASSKKIGQDKSYSLLKKGSYFYHGFINYWLLYAILWFGQRIGAKTPNSRWKS